ncbi:soluble calcium-activated nucleotidase 1 [Drosophila guanche]|uniref:Apyrase n=1 Tax=Drosophila guanche TaxID=7266 RepID=A0A3B0KWJ7_DROGU|nr:soluble calcium-activated nucleotidase 1 [Drosophila guanche]SPP88398.1 blast:Soluble calcium-activated nucleotidase 1 [Drosophila guanche]
MQQSPAFAYRELETSPRAMYMRDWRSALRTPTYRIGNRTVRFNYHFALLVVCVVALVLLFYFARQGSRSSSDGYWLRKSIVEAKSLDGRAVMEAYNFTYPLTPPLGLRGGVINYRIAMIADLDKSSKIAKADGSSTWRSYLKKGYLTFTVSKPEIQISWDDEAPTALESAFSLKGRGMELSELVTFNGRLLSFDDRTGLVYEIVGDKPIPWVILLDGDGHSAKGFKSEWATVKQQTLYVGSMGKEWTTGMGDFENNNPMYVKAISASGAVRSLNWVDNYKQLRQQSLQISWPGYMIHESGAWSDQKQRWFFLPRRCSKEKYNETKDEHMGCNVLVSADENFNSIQTIRLDPENTAPTHGFSSFKFLPGTDDSIIIAIKSEELNGKTSTFITAFDVASGKTLLPEARIETDYKYEGFEFI